MKEQIKGLLSLSVWSSNLEFTIIMLGLMLFQISGWKVKVLKYYFPCYLRNARWGNFFQAQYQYDQEFQQELMVTKESSLEVITENVFNSAAPTQFKSAAFYTFYWTTYKLVQLKVLNL